jgi:hypothetical protein
VNNRYTFWTLCQQYDKIEIPIIQRDYAQGRSTVDAERIRKNFVNDYLINSLVDGRKIELDFVYGSVLDTIENDRPKKIFIPLDGQQRLTTLFLLHWFIAAKENRLIEARDILTKFTYETRPSAHSFCKRLIELEKVKDLLNIEKEIRDAAWYDDEWDYDPTIRGMITMLGTFSSSKKLMGHQKPLFDFLIEETEPMVFFYFIPLEKFGLTENLYIRMNARGKILSSFENFKSEFFKIIGYSHELLEQVKDKMEYDWVGGLWNYRGEKNFTIDKPFMRYLSFVTQVLYFKGATFRADSYASDFLDMEVLSQVYEKEENLRFLIFALDNIKLIDQQDLQNLLWEDDSSIAMVFQDMLMGKNIDSLRIILLYSTLRYYFCRMPANNFGDFIRVVRNLVYNTDDRSIREWPRLFGSIEHLIAEENVYHILRQPNIIGLLDGFYIPQRQEEVLKGKIMEWFPTSVPILFLAEDNHTLKGNITALIAGTMSKDEKGIRAFNPLDTNISGFDINQFSNLLSAYKCISDDDFNPVFGDLINSSVYEQKEWSRLIYSNNYQKHPAVIALVLEYAKLPAGTDVDDFLRGRERQFVKSLSNLYDDLSQIRDVKEQLYLYYILHRRVVKSGWKIFFRNGFNFGWLEKRTGFTSLFTKGINNDRFFPSRNPIFQTYSSQFRYSMGLKKPHALDLEIVGSIRKKNAFKLLIEWANAK